MAEKEKEEWGETVKVAATNNSDEWGETVVVDPKSNAPSPNGGGSGAQNTPYSSSESELPLSSWTTEANPLAPKIQAPLAKPIDGVEQTKIVQQKKAGGYQPLVQEGIQKIEGMTMGVKYPEYEKPSTKKTFDFKQASQEVISKEQQVEKQESLNRKEQRRIENLPSEIESLRNERADLLLDKSPEAKRKLAANEAVTQKMQSDLDNISKSKYESLQNLNQKAVKGVELEVNEYLDENPKLRDEIKVKGLTDTETYNLVQQSVAKKIAPLEADLQIFQKEGTVDAAKDKIKISNELHARQEKIEGLAGQLKTYQDDYLKKAGFSDLNNQLNTSIQSLKKYEPALNKAKAEVSGYEKELNQIKAKLDNYQSKVQGNSFNGTQQEFNDYKALEKDYNETINDLNNVYKNEALNGYEAAVANYNSLAAKRSSIVKGLNNNEYNTIKGQYDTKVAEYDLALNDYKKFDEPEIKDRINKYFSTVQKIGEYDQKVKTTRGELAYVEDLEKAKEKFNNTGFGGDILDIGGRSVNSILDAAKKLVASPFRIAGSMSDVYGSGSDVYHYSDFVADLIEGKGNEKLFLTKEKNDFYNGKTDKINWGVVPVLSSVADQMGILLTLAATGKVATPMVQRALTTAGADLTAAAEIAESAKIATTIAPAFMISYGDNYKEALEKGFSGEGAMAYSGALSLLEGLTETILPDQDLLFGKEAKGVMLNRFIKDYAKGKKFAIKNMTNDFLFNALGESTEEGIATLGKTLATSIGHLVDNDIEVEIPTINQNITTSITAGLSGGGAGLIGNIKENSQMYKMGVMQFANDFEAGKALLSKLNEKGKIDDKRYNKLISDVQKFQSVRSQIPQGLSNFKTMAIAEKMIAIKDLSSEMDDDKSNPFNKINAKKIDAIQGEIEQIIDDKNFDARAEYELNLEAEELGKPQEEKQETAVNSTLKKNTSPTNEKYGTINRNDGKGIVDLTKEEYLKEEAKGFMAEQAKKRDDEVTELNKIRPDLSDQDLLIMDVSPKIDIVLDRIDANIPTDPIQIEEAISELDKKFTELEAYKKDPKRTHTTDQINEVIDILSEAKSDLQFYQIENEKNSNTKEQPKSEDSQKIAGAEKAQVADKKEIIVETPNNDKKGENKQTETVLNEQSDVNIQQPMGESKVDDGAVGDVAKGNEEVGGVGRDVKTQSQEEFAQYLQDNHSDKLSQEQIYKLLTVRPELRERMLNESPQEWAKIFEKNPDYRQQANNVDNNKEMRGNANPAWTGISIGETANQETDGRHKGYVTLSVDSAREMGKNLEQTFKDLYKVLKEAGYNGHLKMPGVYSDLLTRFDNIVIHGATRGDISLALPIIEKYFKDKGLAVDGTKTGIDAKDSNGKETSHTNLLAERVKNKQLTKREQSLKETSKSKPTTNENNPTPTAVNDQVPQPSIEITNGDTKVEVKQTVDVNIQQPMGESKADVGAVGDVAKEDAKKVKDSEWNNTGTEFKDNKFSKNGKTFFLKAGWNRFNKDLSIVVLDENENEVSVASFKQDADGKFYSEGTGTSDGSFTYKDFRGKGLMKSIYDFVDKKYGKVKPSKYLTSDGLGFWESNNRKKSEVAKEELPKEEVANISTNNIFYQGIPKGTASMQAILDENGNTLFEGSLDGVEKFKKENKIDDTKVNYVDLDRNNPNSLLNKFLGNKGNLEAPKKQIPNETKNTEITASNNEVNQPKGDTKLTEGDTKVEVKAVNKLFQPFVDIVNSAKDVNEAFKAAKEIKGVSQEIADAFSQKYNPNGDLSQEQAFEAFYNDVKGESPEKPPKIEGEQVKPKTAKEIAKEELDKARAAFRKTRGGLQSGGLAGIPEFIDLVKAAINYGIASGKEYLNGKDFLRDFRDDVDEKYSDSEVESAFDSIVNPPSGEKPNFKLDGEGKEKERSFTNKQFLADKSIPDNVKAAVTEDAIFYNELPNSVSVEVANKIYDLLGANEALDAILDDTNGMSPVVRIVLGQVIIRRAKLQGGSKAEADIMLKAEALLAKKGTEYGQAIQAFSLFQFLSKEGQILYAKKQRQQEIDAKLKKDKKNVDAKKKAVTDINEKVIDEVLEGKLSEVIDETTKIKPKAQSKNYGEKNKIVTKKRAEEIKKLLKGKFFSSVIPPPELIELGVYHIEAGSRKFADFSKAMIDDLGTGVKKYLKDLYNKSKSDYESKGGDVSDFSNEEEIADVENQDQAEKLAKFIVNRAKQKKQSNDPAKQMISSLLAKVGEKLPKRELEKMSDIDKIALAIKNREEYADVWEKSKVEVEALIDKLKISEEEKETMRNDLQSYYDEVIGQPFSQTTLNKAVKEGLNELGIDVKDVIRKHYTVADNAKRTLVDKLVMDANLSEADAKYLAEKVEREFNRIATERKKTALDKLKKPKDKINPTKKKQVNQLEDEIIALSNLGAFTDEEFLKIYAEKMGWEQISEQDLKTIGKLAEIVEKEQDGLRRARAVEDLLSFQAKLKGTNLADIGLSIWYANVLSGHDTQLVNLAANNTNLAINYAIALMRNPKDFKNLSKSILLGYQRGLLEAKATLKTGYSPIRGKIEVPNTLELVDFKGIMTPANMAKYVRRIMAAADVLTFEPAKEMRAYQMARKIAREEGIVDPTLDQRQRAMEIMGNTKEKVAAAKLQAQEEYDKRVKAINDNPNLTAAEKKSEIATEKRDIKRRVFELIEQQRTKTSADIIPKSEDFARRLTYNYKPEGVLGAIANASNQATATVPLLKLIIPFTNIVANVANESLNYSPIGYIRAATSQGSIGASMFKRVKGNEKFDADQKAEMIIKASIGVASTIVLFALSGGDPDDEDTFQVTADGFGDYRDNYTLTNRGWQPYSIRINGKWYSYKYWPVMPMFALVGKVRDSQNYKKEKFDDNYYKKFASAAGSTVKTFFDNTFLSSINTFFNTIFNERTDNIIDDAKRGLMKTLNSFVLPNEVSQAAKEVERKMGIAVKDMDDRYELQLLKDIPFARNIFQNKVNALGDDIIPDTDKFISEVKIIDPKVVNENDLWAMLVKNKYPLRTQSYNQFNNDGIYDPIKDKQRVITPEEYYNYMKVKGGTIKEFMLDNYKDLKALDEKEFAYVMEKVKKESTLIAKMSIFNNYYKDEIKADKETLSKMDIPKTVKEKEDKDKKKKDKKKKKPSINF